MARRGQATLTKSYSDLVNLKGTQLPRRDSATCRSQLGRIEASLPWALISGLLPLGGVLGNVVKAEGIEIPEPFPGLGFAEPVRV